MKVIIKASLILLLDISVHCKNQTDVSNNKTENYENHIEVQYAAEYLLRFWYINSDVDILKVNELSISLYILMFQDHYNLPKDGKLTISSTTPKTQLENKKNETGRDLCETSTDHKYHKTNKWYQRKSIENLGKIDYSTKKYLKM